MDKKKVQCFFFDALGVEYLAFIMAKCEEYGLVSEVAIGHCEDVYKRQMSRCPRALLKVCIDTKQDNGGEKNGGN